MIKNKKKAVKYKLSLIFCILFSASLFTFYSIINIQTKESEWNSLLLEPKTSAGWAWLNLTNFEINNTFHHHDESISIKGRLYDPIPPQNGFPNYTVALFVDGVVYPQFNNVTDGNGDFLINFTIPFSLNISDSYTIQVNVTSSTPGDVDLLNYLNINIVPFAKLNLTNVAIDNKRFYHNSTFPIEGRLYEYLNETKGISGVEVSLFVDDQLFSGFNTTTVFNGMFQINFSIPFSFDIYQAHKIQVNITQGKWVNDVELQNFFTFYTNATSIIEVNNFDSEPKIPGEIFSVAGILRFDNLLGAGVPSVQINYFWYNTTFQWPVNSFFTRATDGSFSENLRIPTNPYSSILNLNMSFQGDYPNIGYSDINITNIKLFSNITVDWNVVSKATEGDNITITGQIVSYPDDSLLIANRSIEIHYNGTLIRTVTTDENGEFTYMHTIPGRTGIMTIKIKLVNSAGITLERTITVNVTSAPFVPTPGTAIPPFLVFSLVFFPILIGIVAVLAVFGYRYYKKQEKESRVVRVELDPKIANLKILKDSGRLEESLSYLFNAIFMSLIDAKYNRTRKENETIRDFAIVSVKELKLTPAAIYPFIQKVEEIIYGKPFNITEKEFYQTCELFSPLYFELTGNNFILTF